MQKFKLKKTLNISGEMSKKNIDLAIKNYIKCSGNAKKQFLNSPKRVRRVLKAICNSKNYDFKYFVKYDLLMEKSTKKIFRKSFANYTSIQWETIINKLFKQVIKVRPSNYLASIHHEIEKQKKFKKFYVKKRKKYKLHLKKLHKIKDKRQEKINKKRLKKASHNLLSNCKEEAVRELDIIKN